MKNIPCANEKFKFRDFISTARNCAPIFPHNKSVGDNQLLLAFNKYDGLPLSR